MPIVIGGYGFAHGEPGAKKALAGVAAGTGIAVLAVNVLSWLYFLNLNCGDVAHTLILGMTGSGNAFLKKYVPQLVAAKQMDLPLPA